MKPIWNYDRLSGELLSQGEALLSPAEEEVYHIPAFATDREPPATAERQAAVFDGEHWRVVSDWRGVELYATVDGQIVNIAELGQVPADVGATDLACPSAAHRWSGNAWLLDLEKQMEQLVTAKAALCRDVDAEADAARRAIVGDPLRVVEYERAAAEAQAYKNAGYRGDLPPAVASWAEAKGWDGQQAADNILAEAAAWNAALYGLRSLRLKGKEAIRAAIDQSAAQATADTAVAQIRAVANVGPAGSW